jgi:hypothetical protein
VVVVKLPAFGTAHGVQLPAAAWSRWRETFFPFVDNATTTVREAQGFFQSKATAIVHPVAKQKDGHML